MKRQILLNFCLLISLQIFLACGEIIEPENKSEYGIPCYQLKIEYDDYSLFNANYFSNLSVNARLVIDENEFSVAIQHQGWTSREFPKRSLQVNYKNSLEDPVLRKNEVVLSAQPKDASMIKTLLAREVFVAAGVPVFNAYPVSLYINDQYKGLYILTEPVKEEFFHDRGIEINELYKAINTEARFSFEGGYDVSVGFDKRIPKDKNYHTLEAFIHLLDTMPFASFKAELEKVFDVERYLKYMAVTWYIGNWDGIIHNFYLARNNSISKLQFFPWDLDLTFLWHDGGGISLNSNKLFDKIIRIPEYEVRYNEIKEDLEVIWFPADFAYTRIDYYSNIIKDAYYMDSWIISNGYDLNSEVGKIKTFFSSRNKTD